MKIVDLIFKDPTSKPKRMTESGIHYVAILSNPELQSYVQHFKRKFLVGGCVVIFMKSSIQIYRFMKLAKNIF